MYFNFRKIFIALVLLAVIGIGVLVVFGGNSRLTHKFSFHSIKTAVVDVLDDIGNWAIGVYNNITGKKVASGYSSSEEAMLKEYQDKIDEINKTLENVYQEIEDQKDIYDKNSSSGGNDYDRTNQIRVSKIQELADVLDEYMSYMTEEYQFTQARQLYSTASTNMSKAMTIDKMDMIIEEFISSLDKLISN